MIKKLRVTVDGNTYDVTVEMPDDAGVPGPAALPPSPAPVTVSPAASVAPAPSTPPSATSTLASAAGSSPGDVPSPLAGRVTAVVVKTGQDVKEGDHLLTLEAMKMNTFVFSPKPGKVAELKVVVGDTVEEGQPLAKIQ